MSYLTNYYKNLCEQLQYKINLYNNLLNENMAEYIFRHEYDSTVDDSPPNSPKEPLSNYDRRQLEDAENMKLVDFPIPPKNWYNYEPGKFNFCLYVPPPCSANSINTFRKGTQNWEEWEKRKKLYLEHRRLQQQHIELWTRWKAAYEEWVRQVKEWQQRNPGRRYPVDPPYPPSKTRLPPEFDKPKWRPSPPWVIDDRQPAPPGWPSTGESWPDNPPRDRDDDDSLR